MDVVGNSSVLQGLGNYGIQHGGNGGGAPYQSKLDLDMEVAILNTLNNDGYAPIGLKL